MNPLRVLTLREPWATLFLSPEKTWETRSWNTSHRGPLVIHAARGFSGEQRRACEMEPFRSALASAGVLAPGGFHLGSILGVVWITGTIEARFVRASFAPLPRAAHELEFGNFADGRWAWRRASETLRLKEPLPCRGFQRLWHLKPKLERELLRRTGLGAIPAFP